MRHYRPRQDIDSAIEELVAESVKCPTCGFRFVYGRKGAKFCSAKCARAMAQRRYRKRAS